MLPSLVLVFRQQRQDDLIADGVRR
jgi:hypothetical protein